MCLSLYVWNSEAGGSYTKGHVMVVAESVAQAREIIHRKVWELPGYLCGEDASIRSLEALSAWTESSSYVPWVVAECDENAPEVYPIDRAYLILGVD